MFMQYKFEIIKNIIDIIYCLNKRPKRIIDDFIYMADKLKFYPKYLSDELSNLAVENNAQLFDKLCKELIIKLFSDSCNDLLKESVTKFMACRFTLAR